MSKNELLEKLDAINEALSECEKLYNGYREAYIAAEKGVEEMRELTEELIFAKGEIKKDLLDKYRVFIFD